MLAVPTRAVPSQTFDVQLAGQNCTLNVYQKSTGLFMDVLVDEDLIISGVVCQNECLIVRDAYLGFLGDFVFFDQQGSTDPVYTGLSSRYALLYLSVSDLQGFAAAKAAVVPPPSAIAPSFAVLGQLLVSESQVFLVSEDGHPLTP